MATIRYLKKEDEPYLYELFTQLAGKPFEPAGFDVELLMNDPRCHCVVLEHEEKVVGFGSLIVHLTAVNGYVGSIEDLVVHEAHRGKGFGKKIMQELVDIARKEKLRHVSLTSNPRRIAARNLYQLFGFKLWDTGYFVLSLE